MESVHYYFDESGEKGFLNSDFSSLDIGLIAGIALPERLTVSFEKETAKILSRLDTNGVTKMHATELFKGGRNSDVKNELLDFLNSRDEWLLVYEAVYPLGLFKHEEIKKQLFKKQKIENPPVKISQNEKTLRIYTTLLKGLFIKLDEICRIEGSNELLMISDQLDEGTYKEAVQALEYLKQEVHTQTISGFDTETKQVIHRNIKFSLKGIDITVRHISRIEIQGLSNLIFVADFISNTLYRHLTSVIKTTPSIRLHGKAAINGFHLANKIAFIDDNCVLDTLYSPC